jgi:hypothetical protein
MSPVALLILKYLIRAEPFVTAGALLAWIRAGRRNSGMPAMRDYLAVRWLTATVNISLLYLSYAHLHSYWLWAAYLYEFWVGYFVLAWFMLRVPAEVLRQMLRAHRGLQALTQLIFRWLLIAIALLMLPAAVAFAIVFVKHRPVGHEVFTFFAVVAIAQILPLLFAAILGQWAGCRPSRRHIGILAAFCLEPAWLFISSWSHKAGVLVWTNLVNEIVCYAVLAIWTWYAFHPDREDEPPTPNPTLQRWDQLARQALRRRLPPVEEPEPALQGGRPWPRPHE